MCPKKTICFSSGVVDIIRMLNRSLCVCVRYALERDMNLKLNDDDADDDNFLLGRAPLPLSLIRGGSFALCPCATHPPVACAEFVNLKTQVDFPTEWSLFQFIVAMFPSIKCAANDTRRLHLLPPANPRPLDDNTFTLAIVAIWRWITF